MQFRALAALSAVVGIATLVNQAPARADFSLTLTNCNSSFGCASPTGNGIGTVSVKDNGANEVQITVTPNGAFNLVKTGLMTFVFSLAQGIGPATVTPVTSNFAVIIPAGQEDGMGTFQYGLDWTGGNGGGNGTAGPLVFDVTATGLSAVLADFATGTGNSFNGPYYFVADVGCVSTGSFCNTFSTSSTGLAGALGVPTPGPVVGAGLPGIVAACAGLLAFARRRRQRLA